MKYLITYYIQIDNDFIDKRQIVLKNKHNAITMYNKISSEKNTINIEWDELR